MATEDEPSGTCRTGICIAKSYKWPWGEEGQRCTDMLLNTEPGYRVGSTKGKRGGRSLLSDDGVSFRPFLIAALPGFLGWCVGCCH